MNGIEAAAPFYRGLVGRVVETFAPYTEASRVAIGAQFLVGFGSAVGRGPRFYVGETAHHAGEFLLIVGASSKSRKGDSRHVALRALKEADPDWSGSCIKSGASTGEGLIFHVRDEVVSEGEDGERKVVDAGIADKRLLICESEFASVLKRADRPGNTLSAILRGAWDGDSVLSTLTRAAPLRATDAHVSLIAHCTPADLGRYLSEVEAANGYGNRHLVVLVSRAQLLPSPGRAPSAAVAALVHQTRAALEASRATGEIKRTPAAEQLWAGIYADLSRERAGLVAAMTARGEAHVARLSLLYALLDGSNTITPDHLEAALAFWQVCERSTEAILAGRTGNHDADRILEATRPGDAYTLTELREMLGKIASARLSDALSLLVDLGQGSIEKPGGSGGRSPVIFRRTDVAEKPDKPEKDGISRFSRFSAGMS